MTKEEAYNQAAHELFCQDPLKIVHRAMDIWANHPDNLHPHTIPFAEYLAQYYSAVSGERWRLNHETTGFGQTAGEIYKYWVDNVLGKNKRRYMKANVDINGIWYKVVSVEKVVVREPKLGLMNAMINKEKLPDTLYKEYATYHVTAFTTGENFNRIFVLSEREYEIIPVS